MSSTTSSTSTVSSTAAAATTSTATLQASANLKVVGIILAIVSGLLIGSSFVFKKKGLLRSQAGGPAGEGVGYLKSTMWWTGMSMMILGELCNFAAYAFVEAIVVTPLGALSVVICAILSSIFLKEKLTFFGWLGCGLCIIGSVIIALNGPQEQSVGQIREFQKLFLAPGFLVYTSVLIAISLVIIFYYAPKYGKQSMLWYIFVCSMIGGISVSVTTGLGAAIVQTALGDNQFKYWFMYFLLVFVIVTLLTEVYYLNVALALFNTAMVTPTYYVIFTFFSMLTTIILFQGLHASVTSIITLVMGFIVICFGITILQMSKIDPTTLSSTTKLDRRSTLLLQAARQKTDTVDEKNALTGIEDPGMDALRGSFGTFGSIIRARSARNMSQNTRRSHSHLRPPGAMPPYERDTALPTTDFRLPDLFHGMQRHQLYDAPVPRHDTNSSIHSNVSPSPSGKRATIKFDTEDVVYKYDIPGSGEKHTTERRVAVGSPTVGYPPLPSMPPPTEGMPPSSSHRNIDLLGIMEEPIEESNNSSAKDTSRHSLEFPVSRIKRDNEVQSAPPTVTQRFAAMMSGTTHSPFDGPPSNTSLLSFPSVTDSGPSENWEEDIEAHARPQDWDVDRDLMKDPERGREGRERGKEKSKEKSKERDRSRVGKRYPGASEDDLEESISLWDRNGADDDDFAGGIPRPEPSPGGIRLVQPKRPDMF